MKILLAPAETKRTGGNSKPYCKDNFFFEQYFEYIDEVVKNYESHLQNCSFSELSAWFGLKKELEVLRYKESILNKPTMKAIQRYTGVAFDYLDYENLDKSAQNYCDKNVVLFSNLFGAISASDLIPDYKFKQGAKLAGLNVEKFYKQILSETLDDFLGEDIIDLRATYYDKFYVPKNSYITMKFIKDGKVVSHWAKAYRGIILKHLAQNNIQTIQELMDLDFPNLHINEIKKIKNQTQIVYNIV
jgi:cytoplasmic iron level regulating protein YaaA (DUF328/UPF0246 family)